VIITPNLVICAIQISTKVVKLSSMFLFAKLSLSVSIISQVSISAEAAAGEALKDEQYESNDAASGGQFYPLIVETFGVWTPFSRDTLKDIV